MPEWWQLSGAESAALYLSLKVAALSLVINLPLALVLAWVLARRDFYGKKLLNGLVHLPLVLPPVVTGYLLLLVFSTEAPLGAWLKDHLGLVFAFRWTGAALAAALMGLPLAVGALRLSFEALDVRIEAAASTLGASPAWIFFSITLPLILPGLLTGALLAFARALGEFGATIVFVSNIQGMTQTLPLAIYSLTQVPGKEGPALRLILLSVALAMSALIAAELAQRLLKRRLLGHA